MDIDRIAVDRPLVGKYLHAVDQRHDAVGLVGDETRQRAVLVGNRRLQKLGRAANAGERVLDLMRQHGGQAGDRAGGAAMRHLAVDLVGHRAFLEHHDDRAGQFGNRRDVEVDDLLDAEARRRDVDAVFVDRRAPLADLIDQRQDRAAERHEMRQRLARKRSGARAEKILGVGIGEGDECRPAPIMMTGRRMVLSTIWAASSLGGGGMRWYGSCSAPCGFELPSAVAKRCRSAADDLGRVEATT